MGLAGGIFGAIIGGLVGGPWGAVIGGGLGAVLTGSGSSSNILAQRQAAVKKCYGLFFQCLGKLAKADGRVSEDEAEFVRELMNGWQFDSELRSCMKNEFNAGRDSSESFFTLVGRLNDEINKLQAPELKKNLTEIFCLLNICFRAISSAPWNTPMPVRLCRSPSAEASARFRAESK